MTSCTLEIGDAAAPVRVLTLALTLGEPVTITLEQENRITVVQPLTHTGQEEGFDVYKAGGTLIVKMTPVGSTPVSRVEY